MLVCRTNDPSDEITAGDSSKTDDNDDTILFTYSLKSVESFHVNLPKITSESAKNTAFIAIHAGENNMVNIIYLASYYSVHSLYCIRLAARSIMHNVKIRIILMNDAASNSGHKV